MALCSPCSALIVEVASSAQLDSMVLLWPILRRLNTMTMLTKFDALVDVANINCFELVPFRSDLGATSSSCVDAIGLVAPWRFASLRRDDRLGILRRAHI